MATSAKTGAFSIGTGAATTTVTVSGLGFTPTFVKFWWSGTTSTTDSEAGGTIYRGTGWMISSSKRYCAANYSLDGGASSDTAKVIRDDACIAIVNATTMIGAADFSSFSSGQFVVVIDTQFTVNITVSYLALGGDVVADAGSFSRNGSTSQSITGLSFRPTVFESSFTNSTAINTVEVNAIMSIGWATGTASGSQGLWIGTSRDARPSAETQGYCSDTECLGAMAATSTAGVRRGSITAINADGVTMTFAASESNYVFIWYALGNCQATFGSLTTQTDTSTSMTQSPGYTTRAAMFVSAWRTKSTVGTGSANDAWSFGAFDSTSSRNAQATWDQNGTADSETAIGIELDEVYLGIDAGDALQALMDVTSITSTTFVTIMDDADPSAYYVNWLSIGDAPAVTGNPWYAYAQQ